MKSYKAMQTIFKMLLGALVLAFFQLPAHAAGAGQQVAVQPSATSAYGYQFFLPLSYEDQADAKFPLLIFLHGSGERGNDLTKVKVHGPPKIADSDPRFPFIVVSPQAPEGEQWDIDKLDVLLADIKRQYRVDDSRIYLTGLSMGGYGTWDWAIARPNIFAAIVPVCGKGDPSKAAALKSMPIWAFHGDKDDAVDMAGSFDMVSAVRRAGGNPRLTIYPDTGHDSWTRTYADPALYFWLFQQRRTDIPKPMIKPGISKRTKA
jgi:predicted peptidase